MKQVTALQTQWKKCPVCQEAQTTVDPETHRYQRENKMPTIQGYITNDVYEVALMNEQGIKILDHQWNGKVFTYVFENPRASDVLAAYRTGGLMVDIKNYVAQLREVKRLMNDMRRYNPRPLERT